VTVIELSQEGEGFQRTCLMAGRVLKYLWLLVRTVREMRSALRLIVIALMSY
jgi:hypothetical protein